MGGQPVFRAPDELVFGRWASELVEELPQRLSTRIHQNAGHFPDQPALVEGEVRWTYRELSEQILTTKTWLKKLGVLPGDRMMIVSENCRALVVLLLAATEMNAWAVIINPRLSRSEVDAIKDDCQPKRIFYPSATSKEAAQLGRLDHAEAQVHPSLGELLIGPLLPATPEPVEDDGDRQIAVLIYTSGTTGRPKGVMLSHRSILYIASISGGMRQLTQGQRVYGVLPMSHVFGLSSVCLGSLYNGACLYTVSSFDPAALLDTLERERITVLQGVPAMYARTLEFMRREGRALKAPALVYTSAGGSPLDLETKQRTEACFKLTLHNGYGLTEASPTISQTRVEDTPGDNTVGRVLPLLEYRLEPMADNDTNGGLPAEGELWVRGPNVMRGYYRNRQATQQCLTADGWLNTGDIARLDENGQLYIVSRSKELIIRSGFNIYPPDIEGVINQHPSVILSAVVGRQVAGNEEVIAFVQCDPKAGLTEAGLKAFIAKRLAPYKRPGQIIFMDSLPATATGKILKGKLKVMVSELPQC